MGTYDAIVKGLRQSAEHCGGKANLMRHLDAERATFYRAINEETQKLPKTEVLCKWLDKLNVQIAFPGNELKDFALVPRINAQAGAGESFDTDSEVVGLYAFRNDFMREIGVKIDNAEMMLVSGDSMQPFINNGDTVLIDKSDTVPKDGHIYVITFGDALMVKRLQRIPNGWLICSDNRAIYPPVPVQDQELDKFKVYGRVRWIGRTCV